MMATVASPFVILVTHPAFGDDVVVDCVRRSAAALPRGAFAVQLRDRRRAAPSLRVFSWQLREVTRSVGARFMINGHPEMARDVGADGVHVPDEAGAARRAREVCGAGFLVSTAAHSDHSVRRAIEEGADAVLVSPIFPTREPSLDGAPKQPRGVDALRSAHAILEEASAVASRVTQSGVGLGVGLGPGVGPGVRRFGIIALGGITASNATHCVKAGASGVAVVRALLCAAEPGRVARALHDAVVGRC